MIEIEIVGSNGYLLIEIFCSYVRAAYGATADRAGSMFTSKMANIHDTYHMMTERVIIIEFIKRCC